MALFFIAGITAQMMNSNLGIKWFIYMTDQGISFLALHFLIEACLVTARWTWERFHPEYDPCKYIIDNNNNNKQILRFVYNNNV